MVGLAGDSDDQARQGARAGRQTLVAKHCGRHVPQRTAGSVAALGGPGAAWASALSAAAVAAGEAARRSCGRSRPCWPRSGRAGRPGARIVVGIIIMGGRATGGQSAPVGRTALFSLTGFTPPAYSGLPD